MSLKWQEIVSGRILNPVNFDLPTIKLLNNVMDINNYNPNTNFLLYKTDNGDVKVDVLLQDKTIWMPQKHIAELFDVGIPAISKHLKSIFESGELDEKVVVSILEITTQHGAIAEKQQTKATKFIILMLSLLLAIV